MAVVSTFAAHPCHHPPQIHVGEWRESSYELVEGMAGTITGDALSTRFHACSAKFGRDEWSHSELNKGRRPYVLCCAVLRGDYRMGFMRARSKVCTHDDLSLSQMVGPRAGRALGPAACQLR